VAADAAARKHGADWFVGRCHKLRCQANASAFREERVLGLAASTPAVFFAGCASSGYKQAGDTSTSLQKAAHAIDKGDTQIDTVLLALSDLVNNPGPNLEPQFDKPGFRD
jgi:hypothetical protein